MRVPKLITPWRSIAAGFLINGVLFGTWAGHIASVKDHFGLSDQDLSKLLLLLGLGALLSFRVGLEKVSTISISCKASGEHADVGDGDPRFC
ncbi:hypothetical protein ACVINY_004216 [Sinorhizobium meliloti]